MASLGWGQADPTTKHSAHQAAATVAEGGTRVRGAGAGTQVGRGTHQAAAGGAGVGGEGLPVAIGLPVVAAACEGDSAVAGALEPASGPRVPDGMALTVALGQARLGGTERSPVLAEARSAGVWLPASPLRPGPPQPPALGRSWAALTGLQPPHPLLQVLVLEQRFGRGWGVCRVEVLAQLPLPSPSGQDDKES